MMMVHHSWYNVDAGAILHILAAGNMWNPVRRGNRLFKYCKGFDGRYPSVTTFITHYEEEVKDTMNTVKVHAKALRLLPFTFVVADDAFRHTPSTGHACQLRRLR